jgi:hypothetical protein
VVGSFPCESAGLLVFHPPVSRKGLLQANFLDFGTRGSGHAGGGLVQANLPARFSVSTTSR